jgi:hypothetical protein
LLPLPGELPRLTTLLLAGELPLLVLMLALVVGDVPRVADCFDPLGVEGEALLAVAVRRLAAGLERLPVDAAAGVFEEDVAEDLVDEEYEEEAALGVVDDVAAFLAVASEPPLLVEVDLAGGVDGRFNVPVDWRCELEADDLGVEDLNEGSYDDTVGVDGLELCGELRRL